MTGQVLGHQAVVLLGTTASGKSEVALAAARQRGDVEIVSVDSMSVYRGMDIATAKPTSAARAEVRHHMVDLVEPSQEFSVSRFQREARRAMAEIAGRGHRALLVGGTGLYVRAVVDGLTLPGRWPEVAAELERDAVAPGGVERLHKQLSDLDPVAGARTTPLNRRRVVRALEVTIGSGRPFSSFGPGLETYPPCGCPMVGIPFDAEAVDERIGARFDAWMEAGLMAEVHALAARPEGLSRTARQAVGYRELLAHVESDQPLDRCVEEAVRRTRNIARRQWAWFRRDPRIRWVRPDEDAVDVLLSALDDEAPESRPAGARLA